MATQSLAVRELAARLAELERLSRDRTPQLSNSSIEDGSLVEKNKDGTVVAVIGKQYDGTHGAVVLSGPKPPRPNAPTATGGPGLLNAGWDGTFANESNGLQDITIVAPMDFTRVEIHASRTSGFIAQSEETFLDTIESPRGGTRTLNLDGGRWYIVLVARSAPGMASTQSLQTAVDVQDTPDVDALREEFEQSTNELQSALQSNQQAQTQLERTIGDLRNTELPALADNLAQAQSRLDDADVLLTETFPSRFQNLDQAAQDAAAAAAAAKSTADTAVSNAATAKSTADTAASRAATAISDAATAAGIAAGKGKVLVQSTAPGAEDRNAQTLWIDTTNGANVPKRWVSGTTWNAVQDKTAVDAAAKATTAISDAATAKSAADTAAAAAAAAQTRADKAVTDAGNAQATANGAVTAANTAKQTADAAVADAAAAQSKADTAFNDAAAAAGIAAGKGKVLVQSAAPGASDRNAQTLWIDTTNNANTPKRWVSGTTWSAVTDKAATDAATAAASAASAAATAKSAADNAKSAADAAKSTADAAVVAAGNAQSTADAANSAAAAAQSKADTAFSDAATAAGIAAGKGKVLVQSTAPGAEDRNAQTLWIDTTNNANTPKRWTTGTTWAAVTDKKATDAATAAANAASAAATAKSAADAAQATANAAQTAAGNAQSTADNALTMAGSKSKVYYSTGNATGTASDGDTWRKVDSTGNVIAEWRWSSGWKSQQISSEAISNLDVGKLTAGTANIITAVAEKLVAGTASIQRADIANLFVTGESQLNTVTAQRIASNVGVFLQLTTDQLVAGTAQIDTAVMNKVFAEMFATRKLYATQVYIGEPGNMFPDPGFNDPTGWQIGTGYSIVQAGGRNGNNGFVVNASTSQSGKYYGNVDRGRQMRVKGGSTYRVKVWFKGDAALPTNSIGIYTKYSNPSTAVGGVFTSPSVTNKSGATASGVWTQHSHTVTLPDEATNLIVGLYVQSVANVRVIFSEVEVEEVVTPSLIVDGFFQGLRVIGASIETNSAADTGFKLTDDGMVAHGIGIDYDPVGKVNLNYKTRAKLTTRATSWTSFAADRVPGLWFEATKSQTSGATPPFDPAGLIASAAHAQGLTLLSSQQNSNDYRSNVTVDQNFVSLGSRSDSATAGGVPKDHTTLTVYSSGFALNVKQGNNSRLSLNYYSATPNEVNIDLNGKTLKLEDTGWNTASMAGTWRHRTDYGWAGVKWRAINGVFTIMGSATKPTSWITGEVMVQIPTKYLPPHRIMGTNAYADLATGTIQPEAPGAANAGLNFTVSWPYL